MNDGLRWSKLEDIRSGRVWSVVDLRCVGGWIIVDKE